MTSEPYRILLLYAHPAAHRSRINRQLWQHVRDLPGVCARDLYELYPDFDIDTGAEQALLRTVRLVVLQHPIYWYSLPPLLKEWMDTVLTRGFAYGEGGDALQGKDLLQVVSSGGRAEAYRTGATHGYPLPELLRPIEQTAIFCGMNYLPPLVLHGSGTHSDEQVRTHAARYRDTLREYLGD